MPAPNRAEILRRAREAYLDHGRGFVIIFEDREEPHYGFLDELQTSLADEEEAAGIVRAAEDAVAAYDPEKEAVSGTRRLDRAAVADAPMGRRELLLTGEGLPQRVHYEDDRRLIPLTRIVFEVLGDDGNQLANRGPLRSADLVEAFQ